MVGWINYWIENPRESGQVSSIAPELSLKSVYKSEFDEFRNFNTQRNNLIEISIDNHHGPILDNIESQNSFSIQYNYGHYFTNNFDGTKKEKIEFNYELAFKVTRSDIKNLIEYYEYPVFAFTIVATR